MKAILNMCVKQVEWLTRRVSNWVSVPCVLLHEKENRRKNEQGMNTRPSFISQPRQGQDHVPVPKVIRLFALFNEISIFQEVIVSRLSENVTLQELETKQSGSRPWPSLPQDPKFTSYRVGGPWLGTESLFRPRTGRKRESYTLGVCRRKLLHRYLYIT